MPSDDHQVEN